MKLPVTQLALALTIGLGVVQSAAALNLREFSLPERTQWKPEGPRGVRANHATEGDHRFTRSRHTESWNSDEYTIAVGPVFEVDYVADYTGGRMVTTGVTVDSKGNVYGAPLLPGEGDAASFVAWDGKDGSQRFLISSKDGGRAGAVPLIMNDPDDATREIVYGATRGEAVAFTTEGEVLWRTASNIKRIDGDLRNWGPNYHRQLDALISVTSDGLVWMVDRVSGKLLLDEPFQLPGSPSPKSSLPLPPSVLEKVYQELKPLIPGAALDPNFSIGEFIDILIGSSIQVANFFSIDPRTGRIWFAGTSPDEVDGKVDGVSEYGALYGVDIHRRGGAVELEIGCRADFPGGTGTTASMNAEGTRIYLSDGFGEALAVDTRSCETIWTVGLGAPAVASPGISVDNNEIFIGAGDQAAKIIDRGDHGEIAWITKLDMYENLPKGWFNMALLNNSPVANGVVIQAGAGPKLPGTKITVAAVAGMGLLDRETGELRWFAEGDEESVGANTVFADGSVGSSNSPIRRAIARAIVGVGEPLRGGYTKFRVARHDLLLRDAACAGADRDRRAMTIQFDQPDGAAQDVDQVNDVLIQQALTAGPIAVADKHLSAEEWKVAEKRLGRAEFWHGTWQFLRGFAPRAILNFTLNKSTENLEDVCTDLAFRGKA